MKKILIGILLIFVIFSTLVFVLIPGKIVISESKIVGTTAGGFDTCLHNLEKWKQWWPGKPSSSPTDSLFVYDDYNFKLSDIFTDGATIQIGSEKNILLSRILIITKNRDSITAEWGVEWPTGNNPFTRFSRYRSASGLKKSMRVVFDSLCNFADKTENIYGYPILRTTFTEVNLVAYRFKSAAYPATELIYNAITRLRQYISNNGAAEKYYPMINTRQSDSSQYETMVAISVDRIIPASDDFFISQMVPMKDRFLTTEVTGGPGTLERAHKAIEKYMQDHSLSAPARPFEILVTERNNETDTAKWRTRIFYPSM